MSDPAGSVLSIHRYPVKSMLGEDLDACEIDERGLFGDRAYALLDTSDGKVASAKHPRKWAALFNCHAAFEEAPRVGAAVPAVRIRLPDGTEVSSDQPSSDERFSTALGRGVKLNSRELSTEETVETTLPNPWMPKLEECWPEDVTGLAHSGIVTDEAMPEGTFFDVAVIHLLTTATLARLQELYPAGRFDLHRFRPNLLIQPIDDRTGFVENDWIGRTVRIGEDVELRITGPCGRCVMTTLPQAGLPKDTGILRAAVQHNGAHVGVYASVSRGGYVRHGDDVRIS
jgi:uncharacterized protein YcbX